MSYREITLCLEREETTTELAVIANRIGAGLHAYVTGVHAIPRFKIHGSVSPYIPSSVMDQIHSKAKETAATIKTDFEKTMAQGDTNWQWVEHETESYSDYQPYLDYALSSDIVVTGQSMTALSESELQKQLLLKAGTPLVVVPVDQDIDTLGKRIAVAWNATAESARAVRDAIPLLSSADEVQVVSVGSVNNSEDSAKSGRLGLKGYLEHHNVSSTHHELNGKHLNVAINLLEHAKRNNIDLLVMGGFGHSRLYDVVVGAATGEVIRNMHIPVFLSH